MAKYRELLRWALRAWPVLALLAVIALHALTLRLLVDGPQVQFLNKLLGMSLQVAGACVVLYSINDNLGLFRKLSLRAAIEGWLRDFPFLRKEVVLHVSGAASATFVGVTSLAQGRKGATTLEERVDLLAQDLELLKQELQSSVSRVRAEIDSARVELTLRIDSTAVNLNDLAKKVDAAAVGGFKLQVFGGLLAIYGALVSVYA